VAAQYAITALTTLVGALATTLESSTSTLLDALQGAKRCLPSTAFETACTKLANLKRQGDATVTALNQALADITANLQASAVLSLLCLWL